MWLCFHSTRPSEFLIWEITLFLNTKNRRQTKLRKYFQRWKCKWWKNFCSKMKFMREKEKRERERERENSYRIKHCVWLHAISPRLDILRLYMRVSRFTCTRNDKRNTIFARFQYNANSLDANARGEIKTPVMPACVTRARAIASAPPNFKSNLDDRSFLVSADSEIARRCRRNVTQSSSHCQRGKSCTIRAGTSRSRNPDFGAKRSHF